MKLKQELDKWFSLYIRLRNATEDGFVICFTCGKIYHYLDTDCGHFIPRGNMITRFDEINCQVQCLSCNRFNSGNIDKFHKNLDIKYGKNTANKLIDKKSSIKKYSDIDYIEMIELYKSKVNELKNEKY